ncbi:MAG TPA: response regulator [Elusimicrobiota bacterium]|nr:response regulator [Elusimicrobiota bacterium]
MDKKKILVTDDEQNIVELLSVVLRAEGYEVATASNGLEALKKIQSVKPDLVILDVNMPQLDGWNVLSTIRATESTRHLPVLMCTNKDLVSDVERAEALGATGYIPKPFEIERVLMKLRNVFGQKPA